MQGWDFDMDDMEQDNLFDFDFEWQQELQRIDEQEAMDPTEGLNIVNGKIAVPRLKENSAEIVAKIDWVQRFNERHAPAQVPEPYGLVPVPKLPVPGEEQEPEQEPEPEPERYMFSQYSDDPYVSDWEEQQEQQYETF